MQQSKALCDNGNSMENLVAPKGYRIWIWSQWIIGGALFFSYQAFKMYEILDDSTRFIVFISLCLFFSMLNFLPVFSPFRKHQKALNNRSYIEIDKKRETSKQSSVNENIEKYRKEMEERKEKEKWWQIWKIT